MRRKGCLYLYLFLALFVVGSILNLLGFDLARFDLWLDDHADLFDAVGSTLFRVFCGGILALCAFGVLGGLWQKFVAPRARMGDAADFVPDEAATEVPEEEPLGWGCMLVALVVGYFAWVGMTA